MSGGGAVITTRPALPMSPSEGTAVSTNRTVALEPPGLVSEARVSTAEFTPAVVLVPPAFNA